MSWSRNELEQFNGLAVHAPQCLLFGDHAIEPCFAGHAAAACSDAAADLRGLSAAAFANSSNVASFALASGCQYSGAILPRSIQDRTAGLEAPVALISASAPACFAMSLCVRISQ